MPIYSSNHLINHGLTEKKKKKKNPIPVRCGARWWEWATWPLPLRRSQFCGHRINIAGEGMIFLPKQNNKVWQELFLEKVMSEQNV